MRSNEDTTRAFSVSSVGLVWAGALLTLLLLPMASLCRAGDEWSLQSGFPSWADLSGIAAATPEHVFAVDVIGGLVESTDAGATWVRRTVGATPGLPFSSVFFLDANRGWIGGTGEYYRTTDAGVTWTRSDDLFLGNINQVRFLTPAVGWASTVNGGQNFSARSTDGGATWNAVMVGDEYLYVLDERDGVLLGRSLTTMYRSTNQGATWQSGGPNLGENTTTATLLTADIGISVDTAWIRRTTNGGLSWTTVGSGALQYVTRLGAASAVAWWGNNAQVTTDAGATWHPVAQLDDQSLPVWAGAYAMLGIDATTAVATTVDGKIRRTTDGGFTWTTASPHPRSGFPLWNLVRNGSRVYAAGIAGLTYTSDDAGATWVQVSQGIGTTLRDIEMWDEERGLAIGHSGVVLWTTNGGVDWVPRRPLVEFGDGANEFFAVATAAPDFAYAVGDYGYLARTTNGGFDWQLMTSPEDRPDIVQEVDFVSTEVGWFAVPCCGGTNRGLYETNDGGVTWIQNEAAGGGIYVDVDFLDEDTGFALRTTDFGSVLARTTNGGATWSSFAVDPTRYVELIHIAFVDATHGWGVGGTASDDGTYLDAYIGRTTDGGATWVRQGITLPPPPIGLYGLNVLNDVCFTSPTDAWCVGNRGDIYRTTNAGADWEEIDPGVLPLGQPAELYAVAVTPAGRIFTCGLSGQLYASPGPVSAEVPSPGDFVGSGGKATATILGHPVPNPTESGFRVSLDLPRSGHVTLDVIDALGRKIATLVDREVEAGRREMDWDVRQSLGAVGGVYFLRLRVDGTTEIQRLVVVR